MVKDSFKLKKQLPVSLTLLTTVTPEVKDGKIILDNVVLELKNIELKKIEKMKVTNKDAHIQLTELTKQCRNCASRGEATP